MNKPDKQGQRARFNTKIGVIATTVGSAVGLGNIWRFPYEAGSNGGGAFMLCYIMFIFIIGVPVICAEFIMGRGTRSNILGAYRKLSRGKWYIAGFMGIAASVAILSFYSVVAGWICEYFVQSVRGELMLASSSEYHEAFDQFSTGNWRPVVWTLIFLSLNFLILVRGVTKGIERMSNILMPLLFILLMIFCVNSLTLSGASEGLAFLFNPDFSKITPRVLLSAMGQAFFSLSLGLGCMTTYASYFGNKTRLGRTAITTASLDTLVAVLAGVIIFPAVFSFGISPQAGPTLVFEVLPAIFNSLPGGVVWSSLFFFLLILASLTSTISMSEISIAFMTEELKMKRRTATIVNTLIAMALGSLCALSFGALSGFTIFGMTIFNFFDYLASNILLPIGGMIASVFVGWVVDRRFIRNQLTANGSIKFRAYSLILFCLRYVAPAGIALVFLNSIGIIS
ncbi:MAG: sodium-dependent transporter [Muribaculaceae bacterium]|nr:sodium-dependent transporter [Muribaculaceae bacterium]